MPVSLATQQNHGTAQAASPGLAPSRAWQHTGPDMLLCEHNALLHSPLKGRQACQAAQPWGSVPDKPAAVANLPRLLCI